MLSFLDVIRAPKNGDVTFSSTSRVWVFDGIFCFGYHLGLDTMQEPPNLGKVPQYRYGFRMLLTQIISIQRFSHLEIPTKHQDLTGITILTTMGRFFESIIIVDYLIPIHSPLLVV